MGWRDHVRLLGIYGWVKRFNLAAEWYVKVKNIDELEFGLGNRIGNQGTNKIYESVWKIFGVRIQ